MNQQRRLTEAQKLVGGDLRTVGDETLLWISGITPDQETRLAAIGCDQRRLLHQMRAPLPLPSDQTSKPPTSTYRTRAFVPGADDDAWIAVNNRAFAWHPDQGTQTTESLAETMNEPWFDPDGFRLLEIGDTLAGFCWTKVHDGPPRLGEIYVIAVDPAFTGRGLGRFLTVDGLEWLHAQRKIDQAMLYVEANNEAAVALYRSLGFEVHHSDAAYGATENL